MRSILQGSIQVPIWPFPIAPAALPFCALADINVLLDKWISTCYDFVIPRYMVRGNVCPACDEMIDFINCKEVRMSDGLQHLIYLGQKIFGDDFCDRLMYASQTTFFQVWFPGFDDYTAGTCAFFQGSTETHIQRQNWCFWATLPSILLPITLLVLGATLIGFVLPAIFDIIIAFIYFLAATPLIVGMPGGDSQYFYHPGDQQSTDNYIESGDMEALYMQHEQRRHRAAQRQQYFAQLRQRQRSSHH